MLPSDRTILVGLSRAEVASLVAERLRHILGDAAHIVTGPLHHLRPGSPLLADDRALTPERCRELTADGHAVLMLTALLTTAAEQEYLAAGARAYLPMILDFGSFDTAVRALI